MSRQFREEMERVLDRAENHVFQTREEDYQEFARYCDNPKDFIWRESIPVDEMNLELHAIANSKGRK